MEESQGARILRSCFHNARILHLRVRALWKQLVSGDVGLGAVNGGGAVSGGGVGLGVLVVFLLMFLSGRGGRGQTPEGVLRCETAEKIEVQVFDAIALQMDEQRNGTGGEIFFLV